MADSTAFRSAAVKLLLPLFLAGILFPLDGGELEIVRDGTSSYAIVVPEKASVNLDREYRNAAMLLKRLIKRRTGADLPVLSENEMEPGQKALFVGRTDAAIESGAEKETWSLNEYRMKADVKGNLFLLGDDEDPAPEKRTDFHGLRLGSVKAVLEFAKKFVEADYLYPGEAGIFVPRSETLTVPDDLDITAVPYTRFGIGRGMEIYYSLANDKLPASWYRCHGGHSHIPAVPRAEYSESHPEYFAIVGGKRDGYHIPQYCLSNPEVQELIYRHLLSSLDQPGVQEAQLGQTDGFRGCECENCREFYRDGMGEALWKLHLGMAERLLKDRPGKRVRILAYGPTFDPPVFTKIFPENVSVTIAHADEEQLKKWSECKVPGGFDAYLYNWGEYHTEGLTPTLSLNQAKEQTARLRKYGINALYFCGLTELPGLNMPVVTWYLRAFAGDGTAPEVFLRSFCEKAFGAESAPFMEKFYTLLYSRIDAFAPGKEDYTDPGKAVMARSVFAPNIALLHKRYPEEVLQELDALLRKGEENASNGRDLLERARLEFEYLKLTAGGCNAFYDYHKNPGQEEFERLAKLIIARKKFILSLPAYPAGKELYLKPKGVFPTLGICTVETVLANGDLGAPLAAPFNWDVEYFLEKKMRPSGRILKAGDPEWQQMIDVMGNGKNTYVKEHPVFVRCRVEGENLIVEMRFDDLEKSGENGVIWVRIQKDAESPRYTLSGSPFGQRMGFIGAVSPDGETVREHPVKCRRIEAEGQSPMTEIAIPLALFGGPAEPGEKRFIDFNFHKGKSGTYTWEYNINLLNWRHRYTGIGTIEF